MNNNGKITFHNYTDFVLNKEISINYMTSYNLDFKSDFTVKTYGDPVADVSQYSNNIDMSAYGHQLLMIHLFYNKNIGYKINPSIEMTVEPPRVISSGSNSVVRFNKVNNLLCIDPNNYYICIGCFHSITNFILDTAVRDVVTVPANSIVLRVQKL